MVVKKQLRGNNQWWVPALFILYNVAANLSNDIYLPSMPTLNTVFATSVHKIQLTMTAWYLGVALPLVLFGYLSDHYGRKPLLFGGGLCFMAASLLCACASTIDMFIAGRFFQGVGVCSVNVSTFSIVPDLYDTKKRIKMMTYLNMAGYLSPIVGPTLGAHVLDAMGWRVNFFIVFLLVLHSMVGLWWCLPETHPTAAPRVPFSLPKMLTPYFTQMKNPALWFNLVILSAASCGLVVYLTASPFSIIHQMHYQPRHYGWVQLCIFLTGASGAFLLNHRISHGPADKAAQTRLIYVGLLLMTWAILLLLINALFFQDRLLALMIPMMFYTFGLGFCSSLLISEIMSLTQGKQGVGAALVGFTSAASGAFASFLVTQFYQDSLLSIALIMSGVFVAAYVGLVCIYVWRKH